MDEPTTVQLGLIETLGDLMAFITEDLVEKAATRTDIESILRRILYGTDEPCMACKSLGRIAECPTCHGTGRLKTPGLVERLGVAAEHTQVPGWPERTYYLLDPTSREFSAWRSALRREIGEAPP